MKYKENRLNMQTSIEKYITLDFIVACTEVFHALYTIVFVAHLLELKKGKIYV